MNTQKLPVGIDNFEKLRKEDFYYVDKSSLIIELMQNWGEVNLFTRPLRFGKTLNMSMLRHFFEIGGDKSIFDGLKVTQDKQLCETYMGKYPVVFISLKGVDGLRFEDAYERLQCLVRDEALRLGVLRESAMLTEEERASYLRLVSEKSTAADIAGSLKTLCALLEKHYGQKTILLIDEYDVPLDKAYHHGYYDQMIDLIRAMFGAALKTNDSLFFAVLTGCLTVTDYPENGWYTLRIPNKEVRQIYTQQVLSWFRDKTQAESGKLTQLYEAFEQGDTETITDYLNEQLLDTVSFYDAHESFYHGFLLALLNTCADWRVASNAETGKGRCDIIVERKDRKLGFVVEVKDVKDESKLDAACENAMKQIEEKDYTAILRRYRFKEIRTYGIAFWDKECKVVTQKER